jgi:hypothetical protein
VHHGGESGDRENVARDFDGAFFRGAFDPLKPLGMGHRAHVPDVEKDLAGLWKKQGREFAVIGPGAGDGAFIDGTGFRVEKKRDLRNVGLRAIHADVALALLFGIVEGMRVKKRPDKLSADIFQSELEMRVLINGVMAAEKSGCSDVEALLVVDFFGADEAGGVAGAGGGDRGIEGMCEGVAERDEWRSGLNEFGGTSGWEHARLRGHGRESFYTATGNKKVEGLECGGSVFKRMVLTLSKKK